jgi:low affinity Fe/Cu permease
LQDEPVPGTEDSMTDNDTWFGRFAKHGARWTGRPVAFGIAVSIVLIWAMTGPLFGFSDTWQLVINTGTTIITFLMVFLIQNTQNRDTMALQIKLDELIRVLPAARNLLLDLEELDEEAQEKIRTEYTRLAEQFRRRGVSGRSLRAMPAEEDSASA